MLIFFFVLRLSTAVLTWSNSSNVSTTIMSMAGRQLLLFVFLLILQFLSRSQRNVKGMISFIIASEYIYIFCVKWLKPLPNRQNTFTFFGRRSRCSSRAQGPIALIVPGSVLGPMDPGY